MRRYLLILVLLLSTITIKAQPNTYTTSNLHLRSGPGTSYKILKTIKAGEILRMKEGFGNQWIKVHYKGDIGYVSSSYLSNHRLSNKQVTNTTKHYSNTNSKIKYYSNSSRQRVQSPTHYNKKPAGATALCRDGTYSFSTSSRGTCSHHGGVEKWL